MQWKEIEVINVRANGFDSGAGIIENYDIVFQESQTLRSIVLITGFIIKKKDICVFTWAGINSPILTDVSLWIF